jgi:hypothetical protein
MRLESVRQHETNDELNKSREKKEKTNYIPQNSSKGASPWGHG